MKDVTIYFIGGSSVVLEDCNEKCVEEMVKWLDNSEDKKTLKIDIPSTNKTKIFRKELILFIDVI